jgi:ribonucleoside-diphosphate reductase alpha chain
MKTSEIQEALISAAAQLITEDTPNYQVVAARFVNYHLRKIVHGSIEMPGLYDQIKRVTDLGFYDPDILGSWYTKAEIDQLEEYIKHDRDFDLVYAGIEQFRSKYLVRNRHTKTILETPQFTYMLIAMSLFHNEKKNRLKWVKDYYDAISTFKISLPTPIMAGVRTPQRQFSSCVLIESGDDLDSIASTGHAIIKYVANKAGIGVNGAALRPLGAPIRSGDATHTGVIPFYSFWMKAVKSCSQGAVRPGSATLNYPFFHYEVEDLLVLKNNKGTEFNRLRQMDYVVQFTGLVYERIKNDGMITLLNPHDQPGLFDAFYEDADEFKRLYELAEANPNIRKKQIRARDFASAFMGERKGTGRKYLMNVDNVNEQGSFIPGRATVRMTNLCVEVTLPTEALGLHVYEENFGEIALCILSAINIGIVSIDQLEKVCHLAARGLDNLIDFQTYLFPASAKSALKRRPIGVGVINKAYWMAKNGLSYTNPTPESLAKVHQYAEAFGYFMTKANVDLAEERGACELYRDTKYSLGVFPKDTYSLNMDDYVDPTLYQDWGTLKERALKFGVRFSTTMAGMPAETSASISNATNGFEQVKQLVTVKGSKDAPIPQVVPEIRRLKNKYELQFSHPSPRGYLLNLGCWQKFFDQAISVNTNYNPAFNPTGMLSQEVLIDDLIFFHSIGGKNLYYFNQPDEAGEQKIDDDAPVAAEPVAEEAEEDCDSCKI